MKELKNTIKLLIENSLISKEEFENAALKLATLDLEDDQVGYTRTNGRKESHLLGGNSYDLFILDKKTLPSSGSFEILIRDDDENLIGFIRGNKMGKTISFNLIHVKEDNRGQGIGTDIYEKFLNSGFTIKSDSEITDSTYSMYTRLLQYGYTPIIYDDGRIGLKK